MSASCSNVRSSTKTMPSAAVSEIATYGVPKRGCTDATGGRTARRRPSRRRRAALVKSDPLSVPNVESITVTATNTTPAGPMSRWATSAATSFECADLLDRQHGEVRDVRQQVDRDRRRASRR